MKNYNYSKTELPRYAELSNKSRTTYSIALNTILRVEICNFLKSEKISNPFFVKTKLEIIKRNDEKIGVTVKMHY